MTVSFTIIQSHVHTVLKPATKSSLLQRSMPVSILIREGRGGLHHILLYGLVQLDFTCKKLVMNCELLQMGIVFTTVINY